jgi:hypothetical protein
MYCCKAFFPFTGNKNQQSISEDPDMHKQKLGLIGISLRKRIWIWREIRNCENQQIEFFLLNATRRIPGEIKTFFPEYRFLFGISPLF